MRGLHRRHQTAGKEWCVRSRAIRAAVVGLAGILLAPVTPGRADEAGVACDLAPTETVGVRRGRRWRHLPHVEGRDRASGGTGGGEDDRLRPAVRRGGAKLARSADPRARRLHRHRRAGSGPLWPAPRPGLYRRWCLAAGGPGRRGTRPGAAVSGRGILPAGAARGGGCRAAGKSRPVGRCRSYRSSRQ